MSNDGGNDHEQSFARLFAATLNDDKAVRTDAEDFLKNMAATEPHMTIELFKFAIKPPTDVAPKGIRLAAATRFKNLLKGTSWRKSPYFDAKGRDTMKQQIIFTLCNPHLLSEISSLLTVCLENMILYEWPNDWPQLVPTTYQILDVALDPNYKANNEEDFLRQVNSIRVGCLVLRICGKWACGTQEFGNPNRNDSMLDELSVEVMPRFIRVLQVVSQAPISPVVLECQRYALKGIKSYLHTKIPKVVVDVERFGQFYASLIQMTTDCGNRLASVYSNADSIDPHSGKPYKAFLNSEDLKDHPELQPFFGLFKTLWSIHVLIMTEYENPKAAEKRARPISKLFLNEFAPTLYRLAVATVQWHDGQTDEDSGTKLSSKAYIKALDFIQLCIFNEYTRAAVMENATDFLGQNLVPRLAVTKEDDEKWSDDPEEFIRTQMNPIEDFWSPKKAALMCIREFMLFFAKHQQNLLSDFLGHMVGRLRANESALEVDALLYLLGNLPKAITSQMPSSQLENVLGELVAPHLTSENKFLRNKSILVVSKYCDIEWSSQEVFNSVVTSLLNALEDPELPVRMTAAHLLRKFIKMPQSRPVVEPRILDIVEQYLQIMSQMDSDETIRTLRKIVKTYGDALQGFAVKLCRTLIDFFFKFQQNSAEKAKKYANGAGGSLVPDHENFDKWADFDGNDAVDALDELIRVMKTLVKAIPKDDEKAKETFLALQEELGGLFHAVLSKRMEHLGCLDGIVELLTTLVGRSSAVHIKTWSLVEGLNQVVGNGAHDFFGQLLAPIDNMISVDGQTFFTFTHPDTGESIFLVKQVVGMIKTMYKVHMELSDRLFSSAVMAVDVLLLSARQHGFTNTDLGKVLCQELLPDLLGILRQRIQAGSADSMKILIANAFLGGMLLHMEEALTILDSNKALMPMMEEYCRTVRGSKIIRSKRAPILRKGRPKKQPDVEHEVPMVELRVYDRHLFILAVGEILRTVRVGNNGDFQLVSTLTASAMQEWVVDALKFADSNREELKTRCELWEKRHKDSHNNEDDAEEDEWDDDDDSDASTDDSSNDGLLIDEDGDGEEDEFEDDMMEDDLGGDDDLDNMNHIQKIAAMAREQRDLVEEEGDGEDQNLLDETDFDSAIDKENAVATFLDELGQLPGDFTSSHQELSSMMVKETSDRLQECINWFNLCGERNLL